MHALANTVIMSVNITDRVGECLEKSTSVMKQHLDYSFFLKSELQSMDKECLTMEWKQRVLNTVHYTEVQIQIPRFTYRQINSCGVVR